jgi:DNA-directed RNA polymerase specialized sigma24 family protein
MSAARAARAPRRGLRPVAAAAASEADQAITELYQAHYRSLVRLAALLLGPAGQPGPAGPAERIVQDAFVTLHAFWTRRDHCEALAYLRRKVLAGTRAAARPAACRPAAGPASPAAGQAALLAAIAALPAGQREALVLGLYADLPAAEIAAAMGVSPAAAAGHLADAKAALRDVATDTAGYSAGPEDELGGPDLGGPEDELGGSDPA